ncbi:cellulase family glycosylhydrolase [Amycolatopsis sp. H20-H5]|uniref:cellulase family glycosylhydrolase n=1 Tax=Amycolatopsis sp. H20-H5 TaxID=3046309 RepID=UPI002DBF19B6|nr:cellulase family glycosylhydrolase [Amycolatopsis sp. H20-H5]MEC3977571.1 cellulase family glycosylhydrolase [Amycolatopsis sp. H20-H5]
MRPRTALLASASALALAAGLTLVTTATAGPQAAVAACKVDYTTNDWGSGFTANVTVANLGAEPLTGWKLTYSHSGNQQLQQGWNGSWAQSGKTVTVSGLSWNNIIPAAGSVSAGANFSYSGANARPTDFAVNGTSCTGLPPTTTPTPPTTTTPTTTPPPDGTAPALHVSGNRFVNATGTPVTLHGVNRSGAEFACVQGNGIFDGPMDAASVSAIKSWHTNAVRVPLNEDCWLGLDNVKPEYAGQTYRDAIKSYVDLLHQNGLVAILDLHWTQGVYTGNSSACTAVTSTCQKPMTDAAHAVDFWRSAATLFKGDNATVFDLFNEPYVDRAVSSGAWACWRDGGSACPGVGFEVAGMQTLVNAVRATGAANVILLGGLAYANDLSQWLQYKPADPTGNLAASWHSYNFNTCSSSSCWDATLAPVAAQVPLVAGEIGENDCASGYVTGLMSWLDQHGASYLGWTWNTWNCGSGPALISSYDGTPTAFGAGIKAHFLALN